MNRSVMQRQMFAGGGAAGLKPIPAGNKGLPNLPESVRNNMGYMAMGGDPMIMPAAAEGIMATAPAMGASPEMMMDTNAMASMIEGAEAAGFSDPEAAGSFEEMMNSVSGDDKSSEERRTDLASIVGPEDAGQTPESVLALVTPVVELALVDQGIGPMAQEQMNTPVEGDMGGGIMTMAANGNMGVGNEPPVNFKLGGEVRRRGDEDPVPVFEQGGEVQYFAPENKDRVVKPMSYTDVTAGFETDYNKLLPLFQKNMQVTDPETRKNQLQSDILFDIANTALAFAAPMKGEKAGLSAAERLAMAAQQTQVLPKIAARTTQSRKEAAAEAQAPKTAATALASQMFLKKTEQVGKEKNIILSGNIKDAQLVYEEGMKNKRFSSGQKHLEKMENIKASLTQKRDAILNSNEANKIQKANKFTLLLKDIEAEIAAAAAEKNQEYEIVKINKNFENKKTELNMVQGFDVQKLEIKQGYEVENIAANHKNTMIKQKDQQVFDKEKLNTQIKSTEFIANQNNATKIAINDNNLKFKREDLEHRKNVDVNLNKYRDSNIKIKKAEIDIKIGQLDLNKVTEARKKAEFLREQLLKEYKFEEAKAQNVIINGYKDREVTLRERQQQLDEAQRLIDNALGAEKLALQKEKVQLENAFKQQDLMFRKKVQGDLTFYRSELINLDKEKNNLTKMKTLFDISHKKKKLALEKVAMINDQFGKNIEGVYTRVLNNSVNLQKFAAGTLDENTSLMMSNAIAYFNQPKTVWSQSAGRYVTRPPQTLSPAVSSAIEKRIENGFSDVTIPVAPETNGIKENYILDNGQVNFDKISDEVTATLMKENINPDAAGGIDTTLSKIFLPLAGALQSVGFKDTGFFTQDQAEVKKAKKAFEALNVQVNSLARDTITGRLFKQDAENLRKFTKVLKGGLFQNDVTMYDGMVGLRDFVASKYKLAVEILENPNDYSEKQILQARQESKEILQVISELQTGILLFEKRMPGLNPEFGTTQASDANKSFGSGELVGSKKPRG